MPRLLTAKARAFELYGEGLGQDEVRRTMLQEGYPKSLVSKRLTVWPPVLTAREEAAAARGLASIAEVPDVLKTLDDND